MLIGGLQKVTLIDYPTKIACTVFLIGCNFRCPFCQNPELVLPENIKKQPRISKKELFKFLKEKKGLLDGVVIGGGEPTIHRDLPDFLRKIKKLRFLIKLDTNGSNPKMLEKLIVEKLVDYVAMDFKAPLINREYNKVVGAEVDLEKIKKSIEIIKESETKHEFRSTILPKLHSRENILNMAKTLRGSGIFYLQQFRPEKTLDPEYQKHRPFTKTEVGAIQRECNRYVSTKLRN